MRGREEKLFLSSTEGNYIKRKSGSLSYILVCPQAVQLPVMIDNKQRLWTALEADGHQYESWPFVMASNRLKTDTNKRQTQLK